jgi:hypothetical protein
VSIRVRGLHLVSYHSEPSYLHSIIHIQNKFASSVAAAFLVGNVT